MATKAPVKKTLVKKPEPPKRKREQVMKKILEPVIETGIKRPINRYSTNKNRSTINFSTMEIDQCMTVPATSRATAVRALREFVTKHPDTEFSYADDKSGGAKVFRIWRDK